jgi:hypothetical protein
MQASLNDKPVVKEEPEEKKDATPKLTQEEMEKEIFDKTIELK